LERRPFLAFVATPALTVVWTVSLDVLLKLG